MHTETETPESGVYMTLDMCGLFNCSPNEIPALMEEGVIPPPLPNKSPRGKRRWLKATVDKKLGRAPEQRLLRDIIREEVERALRNGARHESAGRAPASPAA